MNIKITNFFIAIAIGALIGCTSESSSTKVPVKAEQKVERVLFQESPMDSVYQALRPTVERFTVDAKQTQTITSKNGIEVLIPSNSFIDGFGNPIEGKIALEILDANSLTDFVTCNLQTLSNNQTLESAGMLYIDAKHNGKSLRLADGQKLSITMPMINQGGGFQMFSGKYDPDGNINWEIDQSANKNYLVPFPEDFLYEHYWYGRWSEEGAHWHNSLDSIKYNPKNKNYKNTLIQTREFRARIWQLYHATHLISSLKNKGLTWDDYAKIKLDDQLFDLYFSNLDLNIEVLDSMANSIVNEYIKKPEFIAWVNSEEDENHYNFWWVKRYVNEKNQTYIDFGSDGAKGNVPQFKDYGVDLLSDHAYDKLIAKGVRPDEAITMINIEKERAQFIAQEEKARALRAKKEKMQKFVQETVFSTSELGWINCDRFLNDPNAGKAEMLVAIEGETAIDYVDCSLIIPSLKVKLSAYPHESGNYTFTKKEGMYTNLPLGQKAIIVGVALQDNKCYFASEEISIKDGLSISLKMTPTEKDLLKNQLDELLSPNT
ncbi:MAG: hypothetical protein N4A35_00175 [Flavobacteriales bacterium]|jgi:hypothetical protein|nr:hypothetical protein [Flavobacteriales bacterium]